jgi:hypothetical protein
MKTIENGHSDVQKDQVGLQLNGHVDGFPTVCGFAADHPIRMFGEKHPERPADHPVVVSDEDPGHLKNDSTSNVGHPTQGRGTSEYAYKKLGEIQ